MICALHHPILFRWPGFGLPITLVLLAVSVVLTSVDRPAQHWKVGEDNEPPLVRFHDNEQNEDGLFRWSYPQATLFLYGYRGSPALVELRLNAPRQDGMHPAQVVFSCQDGQLATTTVAGYWRRYQILLPTSTTTETFLSWQTDPYVALPDVRELGVVLSGVKLLTTVTRPLLSDQLIGWPVLPLLVWWAGIVWGWSGRWRDGLAILALLPTVGLAWFPVETDYWLPTLPWPAWPLVPIGFLAGWPLITTTVARVSHWVALQPQWLWFGLISAFAGLIALRFGAPAWLMLPISLGGVWLAWSLLHHCEESTSSWSIGWILTGVTGVALITRLIALDQMPPALWRDEARHGLLALQIWTDPTFRPVYVVKNADLPALFFYLVAPFVGILGTHAWSVRLVSALAGALTPLALYWFAAPIVGRRAAVLGSALLAWASWSLSMSRWAFPATLDHLLVLTASGLLWRGLDPGQSYRRSWLYIGGAALLGGLAVYTYHTGRLAPLALLVVALFRLGRDRRLWQLFWARLVVAALVGAVVLTPLTLYILQDSAGFNRRVGYVSIFQANNLFIHRPLNLLAENVVRYTLMWHVQGDANGRHHLPLAPMVDPVVGLFLLVGLGLYFRTPHQTHVVVLLWLLYHVPGLLSSDAPHTMRALGTLAPACALAGWGLSCLVGHVSARRWLMLLVLLTSLVSNLSIYFGFMWRDPRVYSEFDRVETVMAQIVRTAALQREQNQPKVTVYLPHEWALSDTVRFLTADLPPAQRPHILGNPIADGDVLVVLPAFADVEDVAAVLQALGPTAVEVLPTPTIPADGEPLVRVFGRGVAALELMKEP